MRWWVAVLLLLLALPRPARAGCGGCPNLCSGITMAAISASPALPNCVMLTPFGDTCDCGFTIAIASNCTGGASVTGCRDATSAAGVDGASGCYDVNAPASIVLRATSNGQQQWVMLVSAEGQTYTVTIATTVQGLGSDPGCSVVSHGAGRGVAATLSLAAAALFGARRRRRRAPR